MLRRTIGITISLLLAATGITGADTITVPSFRGPQSSQIRDAVVTSLESSGKDLTSGQDSNASARIMGTTRTRKGRYIAKIRIETAEGKILKVKTYSARSVSALERKVRRSLVSDFRDAIGRVTARETTDTLLADDEAETTTTGVIDSQPEASADTDDSWEKEGLVGWGAQSAISMKTISRSFSYGGGLENSAPSYTLPLTIVAHIDVSYFWRKNIEAAVGLTIPYSLDSTVDSGTAFPTNAYALDLGGRYHLGRFHGALGYGNQSFQIEDAEAMAKPNIPSVSYHYLRLGAGYWHPIKPKYQLGGTLGYRLVMAAGEIHDDSFYSDSSTSGLDFEVSGKYLYSENVFVSAAVELQRYSHSMMAGTASDLYFGVALSAGVKL